MNAVVVAAEAAHRLLRHLDLGDQATRRRIPSRKADAGRLADQAASAVAANEIACPQRLAAGQRDIDAGAVLRETRQLAPAIDRHAKLIDRSEERRVGKECR